MREADVDEASALVALLRRAAVVLDDAGAGDDLVVSELLEAADALEPKPPFRAMIRAKAAKDARLARPYLVAALREEGLWPIEVRCEGDEDFDEAVPHKVVRIGGRRRAGEVVVKVNLPLAPLTAGLQLRRPFDKVIEGWLSSA